MSRSRRAQFVKARVEPNLHQCAQMSRNYRFPAAWNPPRPTSKRSGALIIPMDLLDVDAVTAAPQRVIDEWGRVDVLVNNAIAKGAGTMDRFLDLSTDSMSRLLVANYVHQIVLTQQILPTMIRQGSGRIVNLVSGSARLDPVAPAGEGGWGIAYAASKAAFGRVAGGINAEFGPAVVAFNVDPGHVVTEASRAFGIANVFDDYGDDSPDMTSGVIAWLATSDDAPTMIGKWIYAPKFQPH
jgi:NAD(P)-dependent dehydrogenase (short-subunit alcohol dehydrogenase family)